MNIRKATYEDVPRIMEICGEARGIMRADGNMNQWTGGYPSEEVIRTDISRGVGYVISRVGNDASLTDNGACFSGTDGHISRSSRISRTSRIEGYFTCIPGIEPTYLQIEGGRWLDDSRPYCTIHRLASTADSHGIARACFDWCWGQCRNLRIDTHEDNRIMRHCIESFGFIYCGVIYLQDGAPRLAYQRIDTPGK